MSGGTPWGEKRLRNLEIVFRGLVNHALQKNRAPFNSDFIEGIRLQTYVSELVKRGRIRVEVYQFNYRVIMITEKGEHYKLRTMEPPLGTGRPWKILEEFPDRL